MEDSKKETNKSVSSSGNDGMASWNELMQIYSAMADSPRKTELEDSLDRHISKIKDSYENSVLGIGADDHIAQFNDYTFENTTLNWYLWLALYNESWVFRRVIDKPSQDMVRPSISILGTEDYIKVYKELDYLKPDLINAIKWSKLFGGSVLVLLFKGVSFDDMEKPIDYKKIKGCRYIKSYVTDRWFGCEPSYDDIVSNLSNEDFGKPKYYTIQFADGTSHRIHHSWVLRFENRGAPNLIKTGMLQGWGYAEGQHLLHELSRDDKLKASIQSLIDKSLIEVIKMPGMTGLFMGADKDNSEQIKKRLEMVNWARNFNSLTFLDKNDEYDQHTFGGLSGLADLLELNMKQISAAVEMPNVLFGDLSNGFTSDDQAIERYDEKILNDCETYLRKPYTKLLKILYKAYDIDYKEIGFTFNSIIANKKNQQKLTDINNLVETCKSLVEEKVMTSEQEAKTIREFIETGSVNFFFDKINETELRIQNKKNEEMKNEMSETGGTSELNGLPSDDFGEDNDMGDLSLGSDRLSTRKNVKAPEQTAEQPEQPAEETPEAPSEETPKVRRI